MPNPTVETVLSIVALLLLILATVHACTKDDKDE